MLPLRRIISLPLHHLAAAKPATATPARYPTATPHGSARSRQGQRVASAGAATSRRRAVSIDLGARALQFRARPLPKHGLALLLRLNVVLALLHDVFEALGRRDKRALELAHDLDRVVRHLALVAQLALLLVDIGLRRLQLSVQHANVLGDAVDQRRDLVGRVVEERLAALLHQARELRQLLRRVVDLVRDVRGRAVKVAQRRHRGRRRSRRRGRRHARAQLGAELLELARAVDGDHGAASLSSPLLSWTRRCYEREGSSLAAFPSAASATTSATIDGADLDRKCH
mmetsp:Transcript_26847/g.62865  ORF Transcript_26847/g.62865 Transcript_26847/m.62865 type:complete len:286 (+) Transcript_26847:740-1597(+)